MCFVFVSICAHATFGPTQYCALLSPLSIAQVIIHRGKAESNSPHRDNQFLSEHGAEGHQRRQVRCQNGFANGSKQSICRRSNRENGARERGSTTFGKARFTIAEITVAVSLVAEPTSPALRYSLHAENFSARAHTLMYWKYLLLPVDAHAHTGSVLFPILPHLFTPSHSVFYFSPIHLDIFTGMTSVRWAIGSLSANDGQSVVSLTASRDNLFKKQSLCTIHLSKAHTHYVHPSTCRLAAFEREGRRSERVVTVMQRLRQR